MLLFSTRYNRYMYTDFYEKVSAPWRTMADGGALLERSDKVLRVVVAGIYGALLVWLFMEHSPQLLRAVMVPLATLFFATVVRLQISSSRPYEAFPIKPLIHKNTHGKSMPSRHMASATIIACTLLWAAGPIWGLVGFVLCAAVGYVRIAGGVHFPRDIAVGAGLAILLALLGFILIP